MSIILYLPQGIVGRTEVKRARACEMHHQVSTGEEWVIQKVTCSFVISRALDGEDGRRLWCSERGRAPRRQLWACFSPPEKGGARESWSCGGALPSVPWLQGKGCPLQLLMEIWALFPSRAGPGVLPRIQRGVFVPPASLLSLPLGSSTPGSRRKWSGYVLT